MSLVDEGTLICGSLGCHDPAEVRIVKEGTTVVDCEDHAANYPVVEEV